MYMKDPEMQKRLMETNPNSFRKMVANFLEANGRGYWDTSEENIERLRQLYMEVEDKIEGVELSPAVLSFGGHQVFPLSLDVDSFAFCRF